MATEVAELLSRIIKDWLIPCPNKLSMLAFIEKIGLAMKVVLMLLFVTTCALNAHGGSFTIKGEILNLHETTYVDFSYMKIQNGLWVEERVDSILVLLILYI